MYAIVKTGGKQYRVEQGQSLLVERLPVEDGGNATLQPLLYVDGDNIVDGEELDKVTIQARVVGHERGPKLRIVKFKPKRGYKRRTGHRQDLTRIEVTEIKLAGGRSSSRRTPKPTAAAGGAPEDASAGAGAEASVGTASTGTEATPKPTRARASSGQPARSRRKPAASESKPAAGEPSPAASEPSSAASDPNPAAGDPNPAASDPNPEEEGNGS